MVVACPEGPEDYDDLEIRITERFLMLRNLGKDIDTRMVGLMFARPGSEFANSQVIPQVADWHYRSGDHMDVYFAGYKDEKPWNYESTVIEIPGKHAWHYCPELFDDFRKEIEYQSNWKYGGGCELIIANSRFADDGFAIVDFSSAICCNLDLMKEEKAIQSVDRFLEQLFRFAESAERHQDPTWAFSDELGFKTASGMFRELILKVVPEPFRSAYGKAECFAIRDISK